MAPMFKLSPQRLSDERRAQEILKWVRKNPMQATKEAYSSALAEHLATGNNELRGHESSVALHTAAFLAIKQVHNFTAQERLDIGRALMTYQRGWLSSNTTNALKNNIESDHIGMIYLIAGLTQTLKDPEEAILEEVQRYYQGWNTIHIIKDAARHAPAHWITSSMEHTARVAQREIDKLQQENKLTNYLQESIRNCHSQLAGACNQHSTAAIICLGNTAEITGCKPETWLRLVLANPNAHKQGSEILPPKYRHAGEKGKLPLKLARLLTGSRHPLVARLGDASQEFHLQDNPEELMSWWEQCKLPTMQRLECILHDPSTPIKSLGEVIYAISKSRLGSSMNLYQHEFHRPNRGPGMELLRRLNGSIDPEVCITSWKELLAWGLEDPTSAWQHTVRLALNLTPACIKLDGQALPRMIELRQECLIRMVETGNWKNWNEWEGLRIHPSELLALCRRPNGPARQPDS